MHHIENCNAVAKAISLLLSEDGVLIIEDPYLVDMIDLGSFEQIYAEHNFILCLSSYIYLFEMYLQVERECENKQTLFFRTFQITADPSNNFWRTFDAHFPLTIASTKYVHT